MTNNIYDQFKSLNYSSSEGEQSLLTLFNLIHDPAIIYRHENETIVSANNAFFLLTNLGESDFLNQSIHSIFQNIFEADSIDGHEKKALLRHKKQPSIPVTIKILPLNQDQGDSIILFRPDEEALAEKSITAEREVDLEQLTKLFQVHLHKNSDESLTQILMHTSELLKASMVCLYKATGTTPPLVIHLSHHDDPSQDLPTFLLENDLIYHQSPDLWTPNSPTLSSLHQSAVLGQFQYIASAPLEINASKFGLLVVGSKANKPNPNILHLLKLIATYVAGLMATYLNQESQQKLANRIRQVVKIQNEIITHLDEGVIILAPDLTIAEINPAAESILGYANVEALRQPVESILIGSDSLGSAIKSAKQGLPTLVGGDLTLHNRSGRSFPAQIMMSPIMSNGQVFSIIILIKDLSQQEQSQATNQQLEQRAILGEVTAIFAHEVRNPINAIMLSLQVMEENFDENDPNLKWINNMREECNKLLYLMDSVLSFAKPLEYKIEGVDINLLISRILERWHPRLKQSNISVYYESDFDLPMVEGDLRALEQVFTNLISNSTIAMTENGGTLGIKITEADEIQDRQFLQISITDTGHGIPDEIKAHMFKPFVTGSFRGTGLGLAITQRIINAHKGKIEVDSYPGGTIFKIFLLKKKGL